MFKVYGIDLANNCTEYLFAWTHAPSYGINRARADAVFFGRCLDAYFVMDEHDKIVAGCQNYLHLVDVPPVKDSSQGFQSRLEDKIIPDGYEDHAK